MEKKFKRTTVTSALPYANGPVHIGHLAGVYVPADIYVRYLRLKKEDVLFIGGSDEHGVPITIRAKKEGITPQDVVDRYHTLIKDSFKEFGISFDVYSRTSSKTHHELASEFFKTLYDKGEFIEKTSEQYYDEEAHQFLADRYITGECPHCHAEGAYGDQCEKCGTSLSPTDLINPKSAISGSKPVMRETKHWYLPLDKHEGWLRKWILEDHKEWRPNVYGQCKSWLDMGLQPRAVSRDLDWGIPVPVEGSMNPCPCGYYNHPTKACVCNPGQVQRYLNRISGPLLDRIDIQIEIVPVPFEKISEKQQAESSASIRERVICARKMQEKRFANHPGVYCNAQMESRLLHLYAEPDEQGLNLLRNAMTRLNLSARAYDRILKVARTIADLDHSEQVTSIHLAEAISYRNLDRESWAG